MLQYLIVSLIVGSAIGYTMLRVKDMLSAKKVNSSACGGCTGCSTNKQQGCNDLINKINEL